MKAHTTIIGGGIILLVCVACLLPVSAFDLNPLSFILKQTTPEPTLVKVSVNPAVSLAPVVTGTPVPVGSPVQKVNAYAINPGAGSPAASGNGAGWLSGTVTEMNGNLFGINALFRESGSGNYIVLSSGNQYVLSLLQTAYLKGTPVKIYGNRQTAEGLGYFIRYDGTAGTYESYDVVQLVLGPG